MRAVSGLVAVLILGVGAVVSAQAAAEPGCDSPEAFKALVDNALALQGYDLALNVSRRCLGDEAADTDPLVQVVKSKTPPTEVPQERVEAVIGAMKRLRDAARRRELQGVDTAAWREVAAELDAELEKTQAIDVEGQLRVHAIKQDFWRLPSGTATVAHGTLQVFPIGCGKPPAACPAYASRVELFRVMNLMSGLIDYADYASLEKHHAEAKLMNARWDGYFNKALPQYWWEVAINGARMGDELCPKDSGGMQLGFCKVPSSQLIVLHPAAGLQWVRGADDKDDLAAAFVVEVFGRNSWRWKDNDPLLHKQFGWSVIAAYSNPGGDVEQWSYGIMLHKGGSLNLGVTTAGDGQVSILVNVNLAEMFFARKQHYLDYLKALRKDPWESLL